MLVSNAFAAEEAESCGMGEKLGRQTWNQCGKIVFSPSEIRCPQGLGYI